MTGRRFKIYRLPRLIRCWAGYSIGDGCRLVKMFSGRYQQRLRRLALARDDDAMSFAVSPPLLSADAMP